MPQAVRWEVMRERGRVIPGSSEYSGVNRDWSNGVGNSGSKFVMADSTSDMVNSLGDKMYISERDQYWQNHQKSQ